MSGRRYTIDEKIKICENAIRAQKNGISLSKHAKSIGISDVSLYGWVKKYKSGTLTEIEIPSSLIEDMTEELNKIETVDIWVCSGTKQNGMIITVERSKNNDPAEYELSMLAKMNWEIMGKGFKFNMVDS